MSFMKQASDRFSQFKIKCLICRRKFVESVNLFVMVQL